MCQAQHVAAITRALCRRKMPLSGVAGRRRAVRCQSTVAAAPHAAKSAPVQSAYVHLPFCKRVCHYCDFPVHAVGKNPTAEHTQHKIRDYVELVRREIELTENEGSGPLRTIFFGGGTPSLVPPPLLASIIDTLRARYGIADGAEIAMEADPGTFDQQRMEAYLAAGVNRVTMGVQSFNDAQLEKCGRTHRTAEVFAAIDAVKAAGVPSWGLDLMSGLPGQTLATYQEGLRRAVDAGAHHISCYDLQVEDGTPFARWYEPGVAPLPDEPSAADMFCAASRVLTAAGYEHYEVSNFALPGHRCRHNWAYWSGAAFLGVGVGATSFLRRRRVARPRTIPAYERWVEEFAASGGGVPGLRDVPPEDDAEMLLDAVMLRLRTADGLDLDEVGREYGEDAKGRIWSALAPHVAEGRVVAEGSSGPVPAVARLTSPGGFLVSNDVIADVFAALGDVSCAPAV
ncbi:unnamed protein product [Pedinophyceae sp. YPF-701]|nr:unnamed protein product [Pedinophyceae sp. YPF-701]